MQISTLQTPVIGPGQDLFTVLTAALEGPLQERDIVCVTSKVVAMEQGRVVTLADVRRSPAAEQLPPLRPAVDPAVQVALAALVLQEADAVFATDGPVYLTLKHNIFIANAGIDLSNAPAGCAILWPEQPWQWAKAFRGKLQVEYRLQELGVIVTDSHVTPLRKGVTGLALAYAGFEGVQNEQGKPDLFGRPLEFTAKAVADDLASVAVLMMGEAGESTPFALIRAAPVGFTDRAIEPVETTIDPQIDLFAPIYKSGYSARSD